MVERLHGMIRERNKVMRGLEDEPAAQTIIDGFRIYYNFIKPHMALNGKTSAQKARLNLQLKGNKWLSLIKKIVPRILILDSEQLYTVNFKSQFWH